MSPLLMAAVVIGYLLGAIPFGLVLTRLAGLGDVRKIGSGSIGATNVLRTGNKAVAALTLLCDVGKGVAAVLIGAQWGVHAELAAGAAVVVGHVFPVWLGFHGGKGVATALGVVATVVWPVAVVGGLVWLAMAIIFRYSSLASMVATAVAAICAAFIVDGEHELLIAAIAILVIVRHHENIRRLIAGRESRISFSKS